MDCDFKNKSLSVPLSPCLPQPSNFVELILHTECCFGEHSQTKKKHVAGMKERKCPFQSQADLRSAYTGCVTTLQFSI